jgi:hypothetical protein
VVVSRLLAKLMEIPGKERHSRDSQRLIKPKNTDFCHLCRNTIEDQCIRYGDYRWHMACFKCRQCSRQLSIQDQDAVFNSASCTIHCIKCAGVSKREATPFEYITKLTQYSFLLRVALSRLCNLLQITGKNIFLFIYILLKLTSVFAFFSFLSSFYAYTCYYYCR